MAIAKPGAPQRIEPLPPDRRPTDQQIQHLLDALPDQPSHVAGVLTGLREPAGPWGPGRAATAADAFEATDAVADAAGVRFRRRATDLAPLHPGRGAELVLETEDGEVVVGYAGELHPAVLERMGLPPRTCGFEIDLDAVPIRENLPAPRISAFPAVLQDVALVVDEDVPAESVRAALVSGAGPLLEDAALFDVYRSEAVGARKKSLAFALRFRADDRTLTEDEASASRDAAVAAAASATGAVLRA